MRYGIGKSRYQEKPLITDCAICGADLYPSKYGRAKRYCSDKCRKEAQRRREQGEKLEQEALATRELQKRSATLPAQVVEKLEQIQRVYGVFVALEASDIALLLIADRNVTAEQKQQSRNTSEPVYDTGAYPLKAWLRDRLKLGKRDALDSVARMIIADSRLPANGSHSLYIAHLRTKDGYTPEAIQKFEQVWEEMLQGD